MKKKAIFILIAVLLVSCLVFALAACETTPSNPDDPNPTNPTNPDDGGNGGSNPSGSSGDGGNGNSGSQSGDNGSGQNSGLVSTDITPRYNISFYTGDEKSQASQIEKMLGLTAGQALTAPEVPSRPRYTFAGWYTDYGTYENVFDFETSKMPAKNLCLYAKWDSAVSDNEVAEYEAELAARTDDEGWLYIHYYRFDNTPESYEPLNLWIWPYQQTGIEADWVRTADGKVEVNDLSGATCRFDLKKTYDNAGKEGTEIMHFLVDSASDGNYTAGDIFKSANYMNERAGFLIVYEESKLNAGAHWRSDGNADQLFNIADALWENGSLHIFCTQDNVSSFAYKLSEQTAFVNPYDDEAVKNGSAVSKSNVNSSAYIKAEYGTNLTKTVSGVGYQIMVASFADSDGDGIGDIRGIINHLDYLSDRLNVNVLWLTPIQLSDSYHGYDIIDYKAIDPKFGTMADYKELLAKCREKDIKVIMDLVLNHTSTNNVWFQKSTKLVVEDGIDYRDFYQWRYKDDPLLYDSNGKLIADWYQYSEYDYYYYGKFSPSMPELNYDNQATRDAIVDVAKYWLEIGVSGFRIDAVKHIYMADEVDSSPGDIIISDYDEEKKVDYSSNLTKNLNFFTYLANEIKRTYPNCYLVGENFDGHAYNVAPYYTAYDGMLDFYMYYNLGELATYPGKAGILAGSASGFDGSLPKGTNTDKLLQGEWDYEYLLGVQSAYSQNGINGVIGGTGNGTIMGSLFTSNHDIARLVNNCVRDYNGAEWTAGQINSNNVDHAKKYALAIIRTMMTMPGISWVYYGDELGMSSNFAAGENKDTPHADRQFRQPFKWTTKDYDEGGSDSITHYGISGDRTYEVKWDPYNETLAGMEEQWADDSSFLHEVAKWTNLKSTDPVLRYGDYHYWQLDSVLCSYTRTYNGVTYKIITNYNTYDYMLNGSILGGTTVVAASPGATQTYLPPCGTIVCRVN